MSIQKKNLISVAFPARFELTVSRLGIKGAEGVECFKYAVKNK